MNRKRLVNRPLSRRLSCLLSRLLNLSADPVLLNQVKISITCRVMPARLITALDIA